MRRFLEWAAQLAVWLVGMDMMAWMLGIKFWQAALVGLAGVVVEAILGAIDRGANSG